LMPHDDSPCWVKWNRKGPSFFIFRNRMAMRRSLPESGRRQTCCPIRATVFWVLQRA
jgi:hypothetical protein